MITFLLWNLYIIIKYPNSFFILSLLLTSFPFIFLCIGPFLLKNICLHKRKQGLQLEHTGRTCKLSWMTCILQFALFIYCLLNKLIQNHILLLNSPAKNSPISQMIYSLLINIVCGKVY